MKSFLLGWIRPDQILVRIEKEKIEMNASEQVVADIAIFR